MAKPPSQGSTYYTDEQVKGEVSPGSDVASDETDQDQTDQSMTPDTTEPDTTKEE